MRDDSTPARPTDLRGQAGTGTVAINDDAWTNDRPHPVLRSDGTMVMRQNGHDTPVTYGLSDDALAAIRAIVREEVGARRDEIARIRAVVEIAAGLLDVRTAGRTDKADRALAIAGPLCEAVAALTPEDYRLLGMTTPHHDPS